MIVLGRIDDDGRDCSRCGEYKPWDNYPYSAKGPRGHNNACRKCLHEGYRKANPQRAPLIPWVVDDGGRECTTCRAYKPWTAFGLHVNSTRGHYARCLDCACAERHAWNRANPERRAQLKLRSQAVLFGLDPDMIEAHFLSHNGLCDICGRSAAEAGDRAKRLSIDHDHDSGEFRGLLCGPCNSGLGHFRDDVKMLVAAVDYLTAAKASEGMPHDSRKTYRRRGRASARAGESGV